MSYRKNIEVTDPRVEAPDGENTSPNSVDLSNSGIFTT